VANTTREAGISQSPQAWLASVLARLQDHPATLDCFVASAYALRASTFALTRFGGLVPYEARMASVGGSADSNLP